jgi:biotin carboxylase
MGLEVLIASRGEHSLITEVHAGIHVNLDDIPSAVNLILKEASRQPFAGILGSDDSTVELAATIARKLQLPHNPPEAARISRRKDLARAHLALSGCPVPIHCLINLSKPLEPQISDLPMPCVIKPVAMSASRGVIRANNRKEFIAACNRIRNIIAESTNDFEKTHVLVEDYIDGIEVAYEGYLQKGVLKTIVLFDKPDPLEGPYFEETIYITPSNLENNLQKKIKDRVQQACNAYGLNTGPVHAELRIDEHDVWILEIASRTIGGDCARLLDTNKSDSDNGFNLEELTIALAMNQNVEMTAPEKNRGVMMIPIEQSGILRRVEGLSEASKTPHIDNIDINVREGHELVPLPEGNQYAGYIFASAENTDNVLTALRVTHSKIKFITAPIIAKARAI